jgi:hypothetical protein
LKDLRGIRTGMTAAEVERTMGHWVSRIEPSEPPDRVGASLPATGNDAGSNADGTGTPAESGLRREAPEAAPSRLPESMAFRHGTTARFRSDLGMVRFTNGRVAAVEVLSDYPGGVESMTRWQRGINPVFLFLKRV